MGCDDVEIDRGKREKERERNVKENGRRKGGHRVHREKSRF